MDRSAALKADRRKIKETFENYNCKINEIIGYPKDRLLSVLKNEDDQFRSILKVESGNSSIL
jgi:hypothetical protein